MIEPVHIPARPRQVRPTLRCLMLDLHMLPPPATMQLCDLDHPIMDKARQLAPSHPLNQVRVHDIDDDRVFRFTHGRRRVFTWLDEERDLFWVCGVDERNDDTYNWILDLYENGELLPNEEDALREAVEVEAHFLSFVRREVPLWLGRARAASGRPHGLVTPSGAEMVLYIDRSSEVEEIWVAMPTMDARAGLLPKMRGFVLTVLEVSLPEAIWEQRPDWPTGALPHYEIAYLGLT